MTEITPQVIEGLDFLFILAECADYVCYASQEEKDALKAAGVWLTEVKEELGART